MITQVRFLKISQQTMTLFTLLRSAMEKKQACRDGGKGSKGQIQSEDKFWRAKA